MWCGKNSTGVDSVAVRLLPVVCTEAPDVDVVVDSGSLKTVSNVASAVEGGAAGASSATIAA